MTGVDIGCACFGSFLMVNEEVWQRPLNFPPPALLMIWFLHLSLFLGNSMTVLWLREGKGGEAGCSCVNVSLKPPPRLGISSWGYLLSWLLPAMCYRERNSGLESQRLSSEHQALLLRCRAVRVWLLMLTSSDPRDFGPKNHGASLWRNSKSSDRSVCRKLRELQYCY